MQSKQEIQHRQNRLYQRLNPRVGMPDILGGIRPLETTCQWVQYEEHFRRWTKGDLPHLWIAGAPGAGKSHLAASIISYLSQRGSNDTRQNHQTSVAFYFCCKGSTEADTADSVLNTLVSHLARGDSKFLLQESQILDDLWSSKKELRKQLVKSYFAKSDVHILRHMVIDGLDELDSSTRHEILTELKALSRLSRYSNLTDTTARGLQILILGRIELDQEIARTLQAGMIAMSAEKTAADLKTYIKDRIDNCDNLQDPSIETEFVDNVRKRVEKDAQGNFLVASLKITAIADQTRVGRIKDVLHKTPEALGPLLESVLMRLSSRPADAEDLKVFLAYVVWFTHPISLSELALVPKLDPAYGRDDVFLNLEERLRTRYGDIFKIERKDRITTEDMRRGNLSPSNISLEDLLGDNRLQFYSSQGHEEPEQVISRHAGRQPRNIVQFNSDPESTKVWISHGRYREFFQDDDWVHSNGILQDKHSANLRILRACLKSLTDSATFEKYGSTTFTRHAAVWFPEYLCGVTLSRIQPSMTAELQAQLERIFNDPPTRDRWIAKMVEGSHVSHAIMWMAQDLYVDGIVSMCVVASPYVTDLGASMSGSDAK